MRYFKIPKRSRGSNQGKTPRLLATLLPSALLTLLLACSLSIPTAVAAPAEEQQLLPRGGSFQGEKPVQEEGVLQGEGESPAQENTAPLNAGSASGTRAAAVVEGKDEVVYGLLGHDGSVNEAYVVNHFRLSTEGSFSDFGSYREVSNLTNTAEVITSGDEIRLKAHAGDFYYQGTMAQAVLPWQIGFSYTFNGKQVAASELSLLAGQRGTLGITVTTKREPEADPSFYKHYTLQIAVALPNEHIANLSAADAVVASAGSNTQVNFTVLPESDATFRLSVDFSALTMPGISITAVPFGMSFELPDTSGFSGELSTLVSAVSELSLGAQQLSGGTSQLTSGLELLRGGSNTFSEGLTALSSSSSSLAASSTELNAGLAQTAEALKLLGLSPDILALPEPTKTQLLTLLGAVGQLSSGYTQLDTGLQSYTSGVDTLAGEYARVNEGISQSVAGAKQLESAASQLSGGTSELAGGLQSMPEEMQRRIDEFAAAYDFSGFEPHSYLSKKNTKTERVQFVLTTPAIDLPAKPAAEDDTSKESTILDRFLALCMPEEN